MKPTTLVWRRWSSFLGQGLLVQGLLKQLLLLLILMASQVVVLDHRVMVVRPMLLVEVVSMMRLVHVSLAAELAHQPRS